MLTNLDIEYPVIRQKFARELWAVRKLPGFSYEEGSLDDLLASLVGGSLWLWNGGALQVGPYVTPTVSDLSGGGVVSPLVPTPYGTLAPFRITE